MTARTTGVLTQEEVAQAMGISRARVMQLEQSAIRKIRERLAQLDPELFSVALGREPTELTQEATP